MPVPGPRPGHVLIRTSRSLISAGTERMLVEFGRAGWIEKARQQPDKVRQVLEKVRTDGLGATLEAVLHKLDQPLPLGYCNAGEVIEARGERKEERGESGDGGGVDFKVGDRVVSNGPHAEVVCVPKNLCARVPDKISDEEAAFTVLAAVGLQGIRLAEPTLGENVVLMGLGLVGLLTVQMLVANGCRVLGFDLDPGKVALARNFGAEAFDLSTGVDPVAAAMGFSNGRGVDAVLITASTRSSAPVHQAAQMCRKRGRIVLVGVTGLELNRSDFYDKELSFQVSCSYGPGRYDPAYEQKGQDYPYGFVRWTAQRNFEAVLDMMARGKLDVKPLISRRVPFEEAPGVYEELTGNRSLLGVILTYAESPSRAATVEVTPPKPRVQSAPESQVRVGVIGAGNFASMVFLPALAKTGMELHTIAAGGGTSAAVAARKFGFRRATSDHQVILDDPEINTVFILTRHNTHARLVLQALRAGKHVFVEKPLCLTIEELGEIQSTYSSIISSPSPLILMVGFNRRFAPLAQKMRQLLQSRTEPLTLVYMVNAGAVPPDHWTQDPHIGGGRIIGEACHFIDFLRYLVGHPITDVVARSMGRTGSVGIREDKVTITLSFADGSLGTVHYFANGNKRFPKERVEAFSQGRILTLDNFKELRGYSCKGFKRQRLWRQDKGHRAEVAAFVERVRTGGECLIPWAELEEVSRATFDVMQQVSDS